MAVNDGNHEIIIMNKHLGVWLLELQYHVSLTMIDRSGATLPGPENEYNKGILIQKLG